MTTIAFTGRRKVLDQDRALIKKVTTDLIWEHRPSTLIFGGASGVDTFTMEAALQVRNLFPFSIVLVCPCELRDLPDDAYSVSCGMNMDKDAVIELRNPLIRADGWASFKKRNCYMADLVKQAEDNGFVQAFWDLDRSGGTFHMMEYSRSIGVLVQYVEIGR